MYSEYWTIIGENRSRLPQFAFPISAKWAHCEVEFSIRKSDAWTGLERNKKGQERRVAVPTVLALPDRIAFPADGRSRDIECAWMYESSYILPTYLYMCACVRVCARKCICKRNVNVTDEEETEPRDACRARRAPA